MQTPKLKSGVKDLQNLKGLNHKVQESDWVESLDLNTVMMIFVWKDWSAYLIHDEALWQRCDYATDSVRFDDGTSRLPKIQWRESGLHDMIVAP